jgi:SAP domain
VPSDRIKGAAITGAVVGLLASKGIFVSSAAGLSAAYLAISKGVAGDVLRTVGGIAWDVTDTAVRLLSIVANNDKLKMLPRGLAQKTLQALQNSQLSAQYLEQATADTTDMEAAERAYLESQEDLARVLEEAEAVINEADLAIAKAQAIEEDMEESVDVSIPYDAAARLAYEDSDKSVPFATFQSKFVADAVEMVKSKQAARFREKKEAEAQRRAKEEEEARIKVMEEDEEKARIKAMAEEEEKALIKAMKEEEEKARIKATEEEEEKARIKAMEEEDDDDDDDDDDMDDDDFLAAIEIAQEGLDGKIVGIEDAIADTSAKAEWDAAGSLARELQQDEDFDDDEFDDDDGDILLDSDAFEGLDLEALGKAAREAVKMFDDMDETDEMVEEAGSDQSWSSKTVNDLREELKNRGLSTTGNKAQLIDRLEEFDAQMSQEEVDDEDDDEFDDEDDDDEDMVDIDLSNFDIDELGRQAREAVQMFQSGTDNFDDEEPTAEMLAELESEMTINGEHGGGSTEDFSEMTVAQLKDECRNRGLKVSGRKSELIERLEAEAS